MRLTLGFIWLGVVLLSLCSCVEDTSSIDSAVQPEEGDSGSELGEDITYDDSRDETIAADEDVEPVNPKGSLPDYEIKPGDVLDIDGGRHGREINKQVRVDDKGFIKLIHIDRVKISELTKWEAEDLLVEKFKPFFANPQITVEIMNLVYFIGGEVKSPGPKEMPGDVTLTQAIQTAMGPTIWANKKNVTIRRKDKQGKILILKFNCEKIEKGEEEDPYIKPNDQITVPRGGGLLGG